MDTLTREERSRQMSLVRSRDTKPEIRVRRLLHRMGFRFRLHDERLPGRPDIILPRLRIAIFVHGCFWHRHHCINGQRMPRSRKAFWSGKFIENCRRDRRAQRQLRRLGWRVLVIWECQLGHVERLEARVQRIERVSSAMS